MNSFIHQDGHCSCYEQIPGANLAKNEMTDYDNELTIMVNSIKWMLRETGGKWPLLGAAVIDRLQDIVEEAEAWDKTE